MRLDQFIFCEVARQEASGQFTLIGVMPGNRVVLGSIPEQGGPISGALLLQSFTIFTVFDYMTGITEVETQCEVMRETQVIQRTAPQKDRRSDPKARFHTHVFSFMPLPLPGFGDYMFKVILKAHGKTASFARRLTVAREGERQA